MKNYSRQREEIIKTVKESYNHPTAEDSNVSKTDIQNIKNFLIEEYEVNEKCLKIN